MRWHLIVDPDGRPGSDNMLADYALLQAARDGDGFLRLYQWNPPCLSFGRNEAARRRYDWGAIAAMGIDTVRRPTGGRAVWHHRELTYAVAAPIGTFGSLSETYLSIHRTLATALARLGAPVSLATPGRGAGDLSGGPCFASPVGGEIVCLGHKLVGSAQLREGSAFLQHGSILLENDQDVVSQVCVGPSERPRAISLTDILGHGVSAADVGAVIAQTARSSWRGHWMTDQPQRLVPTPAMAGPIDFTDSTWTWRR